MVGKNQSAQFLFLTCIFQGCLDSVNTLLSGVDTPLPQIVVGRNVGYLVARMILYVRVRLANLFVSRIDRLFTWILFSVTPPLSLEKKN